MGELLTRRPAPPQPTRAFPPRHRAQGSREGFSEELLIRDCAGFQPLPGNILPQAGRGDLDACLTTLSLIERPVDPAALRQSAVAVLRVTGLKCGNCANQVRNHLLDVEGVLRVGVELDRGLVRVNIEPDRTNLQQLLDAVRDAGEDGHHPYQATLVEATW